MDYIRIDTDHINDEVLYNIAKWHNETPRIWIPDYIPTEEEIAETIARMKDKEAYICIAKDQVILGFIWAEKQDQDVMILSLYVDESIRQKSVGTELKLQLEHWCRENEIRKIKTTVHSKNKKMLLLNEKLGYESKMVHMEKIIDE
ncbi:GNAT family N-acetyltransferase [Acidaminobacter sp. JC074]|uniref:GNAT family N-acetyltransferase n=1 Tax=Acidaminobacter sp. JC074 TaxID=2530199 RepID=UPI001F0D21EF|nr:GNAT family N-acetyltransferase [Acidaminobacter sp. JC074]MCH4887175.1 GNAT family N-acetyltransferase [Acidaminobacter sp. JC074]